MRTEIDPNESISSVNAFTKRTEIDLRSVSGRFKLDRSQCERPLILVAIEKERNRKQLEPREWDRNDIFIKKKLKFWKEKTFPEKQLKCWSVITDYKSVGEHVTCKCNCNSSLVVFTTLFASLRSVVAPSVQREDKNKIFRFFGDSKTCCQLGLKFILLHYWMHWTKSTLCLDAVTKIWIKRTWALIRCTVRVTWD